MKEYQVGPCELSSWDYDYLQGDHEWIIYFYRTEPYEGYGNALIKLGENRYLTVYLGHYSCYGPLENINYQNILTKEEVIETMRSRDIDGVAIFNEGEDLIYKKFLEIENINV